MPSNLEPAGRLLVEIQATANLDRPTVGDSYFAIMQIGVELDLDFDAGLDQDSLQLTQFFRHSRKCPKIFYRTKEIFLSMD